MKMHQVIQVLSVFCASQLLLGQMNVKDGDGNVLMQVNAENSKGTVSLSKWNEGTAPAVSMDKLVNINGTLYWNGVALGSAASAGGWADDGTVVRLMTSSDKVGIGTATPAGKFHVLSTQANTKFIFESNGTNGNPSLQLKATTPAGHAEIICDRADAGGYAAYTLASGGAGKWGLGMPYSGDTEEMNISSAASGKVMTFKQNGNIGVNNGNPEQKLDVSGTVKMTGFKMPTSASAGYVLTSDASGVGTWQAASGSGDDGDWTISGNDMYAAVSGNVGIGTSGTPNEKLVVDGGNLYVKSGNSMLKGGGGGARTEFVHSSYLGYSNTYCEVVIQGANPGDAALVVEAHRIYGNGSGYGAVYGKQTWIVSCEGSTATMPSTIVEYPGEYDEAAADKITLTGEDGPLFRVRFYKNYTYDNGSVRIILFGAFDPETTTFSTTDN